MLKPWLIILGLMAGGTGCVLVVSCVYVNQTALGHPMNFAGDGILCPKCHPEVGLLKWQGWSGSTNDYKCQRCGHRCRITMDPVTRKITWH